MTASCYSGPAPIDFEGAPDFTALAAGLRSVREDWRRSQARHVEYGDHGFPLRPGLAQETSLRAAPLVARILAKVVHSRTGSVWIASSIPPGSRVRQQRPMATIEAADPCA